MGVQLTSTLVIGTKYYVSFYASNADSVDGNSSSNNLGIRFSTISYSFSSQPPPLNNTSHIHADSIITDKINWTRVAGSIIADSAYQYLIIANFYDDAHTLVDTLPTFLNKCAYYYIDAVCVTTDSVYDANWIGISEIPNHNSEIKIFPNPFHSTFTLHCPQAIINSQLKIYNSLGEIIRQQIITSPNQQIDLEVGAGVYFLKIEGYPVFTQKLLVH
jgi:hypothetical protein